MEYAMSNSPEEAFRKKIGEQQDPPEQIVGDGKIHRYGPKQVLWYLLHLDNIPSGVFGDWRNQDQQHKWCAKGASEMTAAERTAHRGRMERIRRKRDEEKKRLNEQVQDEAKCIWEPA